MAYKTYAEYSKKAVTKPAPKRKSQYFAILIGDAVEIRRSAVPLQKIKSVLKVPRLKSSPVNNEDGSKNTGTTITQIVYKGGKLVALCKFIYFPFRYRLINNGYIKLSAEEKALVMRYAYYKTTTSTQSVADRAYIGAEDE